MQAIKKIYWWQYDNFLKQKCLNVSLYTVFYNKTSSINGRKYGYQNSKTQIISGNSKKSSTFAPKIWIPHPPTVIPFFLVDSCRKNKIRTNDLEIHWKNKNSEFPPRWSGFYLKKCMALTDTLSSRLFFHGVTR